MQDFDHQPYVWFRVHGCGSGFRVAASVFRGFRGSRLQLLQLRSLVGACGEGVGGGCEFRAQGLGFRV